MTGDREIERSRSWTGTDTGKNIERDYRRRGRIGVEHACVKGKRGKERVRTGARKRCWPTRDRANNREAKLIGRVELTFPGGTRTAELETPTGRSRHLREIRRFLWTCWEEKISWHLTDAFQTLGIQTRETRKIVKKSGGNACSGEPVISFSSNPGEEIGWKTIAPALLKLRNVVSCLDEEFHDALIFRVVEKARYQILRVLRTPFRRTRISLSLSFLSIPF